MEFLIQTINNEIIHDFSFMLIESIKYNNWLYNSDLKYTLSDNIQKDNCIPVGTVDFVISYIQHYYNKTPKPKNIPDELLSEEWTKRIVINGTEKDIIDTKFVKSNDKIKAFTNICDYAPIGNYQISDVISINSEWRAFIYNKEIVGLCNYAGDFTIFPDVKRIQSMVNAYSEQPISYTLDVAINDLNETVIIEVHDFFSCGLYGFNRHDIYPYMLSQWFYNYKIKK